jgi:hypothetical protein
LAELGSLELQLEVEQLGLQLELPTVALSDTGQGPVRPLQPRSRRRRAAGPRQRDPVTVTVALAGLAQSKIGLGVIASAMADSDVTFWVRRRVHSGYRAA